VARAQRPGADDALVLQAGARLCDGFRPIGDVDAVGTAARGDKGRGLDDERDIGRLDRADEAFDALDLAAFVALGEAQQHGRDVAAGEGLHQAEGHRLGVRDGGVTSIRRVGVGALVMIVRANGP
jgi:hypothetical protein